MTDKTKESVAMDSGSTVGRAEITDRTAIENLDLRPRPQTLEQLRKVEEAAVLAEQKLGGLRVA